MGCTGAVRGLHGLHGLLLHYRPWYPPGRVPERRLAEEEDRSTGSLWRVQIWFQVGPRGLGTHPHPGRASSSPPPLVARCSICWAACASTPRWPGCLPERGTLRLCLVVNDRKFKIIFFLHKLVSGTFLRTNSKTNPPSEHAGGRRSPRAPDSQHQTLGP